jgi:hypothetical protein
MALDLSSATAWRGAISHLKRVLIVMLIVAPVAFIVNLSQGRQAIPSSFATATLIIVPLFAAPPFLWWFFLWLSERTFGARKNEHE